VNGVALLVVRCYHRYISKEEERKMTITTTEFTKTQLAANWKTLRAEAIAALGLPADARVRINNNAVTLHANIDGAWVPVMNGSANDMKDWAGMRDYTLRLTINV
jgi:hypothetical protein